MAVKRTPEEWASILEEFKESGQTQAGWSREHGISAKTLQNHIREESRKKQSIKRSAEEWSILISKQKASGMNRTAWCRKHRISADSMTSAEKRINACNQDTPGPEWVELSLGADAAADPTHRENANSSVKIRCSGIEMEIDADYPVEKLALLIGRLVKQC